MPLPRGTIEGPRAAEGTCCSRPHVFTGVTSIISVGMMTAKFALFCEASFWRVLHLAVAERPVFPGVVDEIDPDVFFPYASPLVDLIGYPLIEFFLHLNGPTAKST